MGDAMEVGMCVRNEEMGWLQRLVGLVPVMGFIAIQCKPGIWRHVWVAAEMVWLGVVVVVMFASRLRDGARRF